MAKFNWTECDNCIEMLRSMGCAAVVITPGDILTLTADDEDEPTVSEEAAQAWMVMHHDDVEEAILGDYWGDTLRDLISYTPIEA